MIPEYRDYVWGGSRLRPEIVPTAEAWVVYEQDQVADGPYAGKTLAEVVELEGEALLGSRVVALTGKRFPLLIKLLDCARWLSLQVHPNNQQAERLAGPGYFGKTEAWYVVAAEEVQMPQGCAKPAFVGRLFQQRLVLLDCAIGVAQQNFHSS